MEADLYQTKNRIVHVMATVAHNALHFRAFVTPRAQTAAVTARAAPGGVTLSLIIAGSNIKHSRPCDQSSGGMDPRGEVQRLTAQWNGICHERHVPSVTAVT